MDNHPVDTSVQRGALCKDVYKRQNKGTYGKILIAAGSEGMCGAAYLSALAAYRMGAGLVKILTGRANEMCRRDSRITAPVSAKMRFDFIYGILSNFITL